MANLTDQSITLGIHNFSSWATGPALWKFFVGVPKIPPEPKNSASNRGGGRARCLFMSPPMQTFWYVFQNELGFTEDQTHTVIKTYDRNSDNKLNYEEFIWFYWKIQEKYVLYQTNLLSVCLYISVSFFLFLSIGIFTFTSLWYLRKGVKQYDRRTDAQMSHRYQNALNSNSHE